VPFKPLKLSTEPVVEKEKLEEKIQKVEQPPLPQQEKVAKLSPPKDPSGWKRFILEGDVGDPDALITYILAGTAKFVYAEELTYWASCFPDTYADLALKSYIALTGTYAAHPICGRMSNYQNFYAQTIYGVATTADHIIRKMVAGTLTNIVTEAVDLVTTNIRSLKFSCLGTTLKAYRADLTTPKLTATDTSFASGYFGIQALDASYNRLISPEGFLFAKKEAASSSSPQPLAYFEVPIIGDGSLDNPFRAQMPEYIVEDNILGKRNLLAVSHSALIPTDAKTGKPIHGTALIRIFEQPERDSRLYPISKCLDALRAISGVSELARGKAIKRAKQMDDKLCDFDLTITSPTKQQISDYVAWRRSVFNIDMTEEQAQYYLASDKGW
jgi:hypothetical protein